jgi:heme/copper-type cytochrome/quinol oxidase subunit 2
MRSIALVTMVFLPGTFLAAVFSMTFFDWSGEGGKTRVSSYLWIYITITAVFTLLTVGSWYFLVLHRRQHKMAQDTESEPLV